MHAKDSSGDHVDDLDAVAGRIAAGLDNDRPPSELIEENRPNIRAFVEEFIDLDDHDLSTVVTMVGYAMLFQQLQEVRQRKAADAAVRLVAALARSKRT